MSNIISIQDGRDIGIRPRARKPGPEKQLVDWFLNERPMKTPSGLRLTIFEEPRIESGFPDLVFVSWDEQVTRGWSEKRLALTSEDLKLLQLIRLRRTLTKISLDGKMNRQLESSLGRLEDADVVTRTRQGWRIKALDQIFAVRQIVAIEAKIDRLSSGLDQAFLNTWFASHSLLLVPRPPSAAITAKASSFGLGIWSRESGMMVSPSVRHLLPKSYASWSFNEWAWKAALGEEVRSDRADARGRFVASWTVPKLGIAGTAR